MSGRFPESKIGEMDESRKCCSPGNHPPHGNTDFLAFLLPYGFALSQSLSKLAEA
jgi:hypothetical protein